MRTWFSTRMFNWVHGHNLIYNTCWEDPRLDRQAMQLTEDDTVMVITSAGCNTLDYALQGPKQVYAVDMNRRQNALLQLKCAGIRTLDYDEFFQLFGRGWMRNFPSVYESRLRPELQDEGRQFWDTHARYFKEPKDRGGLYYHGTTGYLARFLNWYLDGRDGLRESMDNLLDAPTIDDQRAIYYGEVRQKFWNAFMRWFANRDATMAMVGVPQAQRKQVETYYGGRIAWFVEECIDTVFAWLPIADNYFWRVYLTGSYSPHCCPEYLKEDNFELLKGGLVDRISTHTQTIESFLRGSGVRISRYVLLDHMDWLASARPDALQAEWQQIVNHAAPDTRIIFRSGGMKVDYVDPILVTVNNRREQMGELLTYDRALAAELHVKDRVHTYGSFYIADLDNAVTA